MVATKARWWASGWASHSELIADDQLSCSTTIFAHLTLMLGLTEPLLNVDIENIENIIQS